jgi:N utilization substance protein B
MARRSKARAIAIQMLYQIDVNSDVDVETVRHMVHEQLKEGPLRDFCWQLFVGVMEYRLQLDERITSVAENWTIDRMAPTDRNVLRLGAFELLHTETPHRVVIDEAIELARKFGTAQSSPFVNGLLDKLIPQDADSEPLADDANEGE